MAVPPKVSAFADWVTTLGLPVLLAAGVLILANSYSQSGSIGRLSAQMEAVQDDVEEVDTRFDQLSDALAMLRGDLNVRFDQLAVEVGRISARVQEAETDPLQLLARSGFQMSGDLVAQFVNDRLILFPKTDEAVGRLQAVGMTAEQITPFLEGYVMGAGAIDAMKAGNPPVMQPAVPQ